MSLVDMRSHPDNCTMENNWSFSEPDMKLHGTYSLHHIVMWGMRNAQILSISVIPYSFLQQGMRWARHFCILRGIYMECGLLPMLNWRKDHISNALDSLFLHSCWFFLNSFINNPLLDVCFKDHFNTL